LPEVIRDVGSRPTISRKLLTESYLRGWAGWQPPSSRSAVRAKQPLRQRDLFRVGLRADYGGVDAWKPHTVPRHDRTSLTCRPGASRLLLAILPCLDAVGRVE